MADFLTRLAGRTLGVMPTVQPMIAPLYAPGPALPAGQMPLPVFTEEISGGSPDQPSLWPAGPQSVHLSPREPLQVSVQEQENGANLSASQMSFSLRQDTVFPSTGEIWASTAQSAISVMSGDSLASRRDTPSSISATAEGSEPGAAQYIPLSSPTTPLPAPDKASPLQIREVQALLVEEAQRRPGSASFITQEYQESDTPQSSMHSIERQRTAGILPQSALPTASRSRANIRWAAADVTTNRHELSPEGTAPVTPPAPTIQVTIGRIEVRATQPPPAQRQAPRQGPRMVSLEEYLDRQAKGGQ